MAKCKLQPTFYFCFNTPTHFSLFFHYTCASTCGLMACCQVGKNCCPGMRWKGDLLSGVGIRPYISTTELYFQMNFYSCALAEISVPYLTLYYKHPALRHQVRYYTQHIKSHTDSDVASPCSNTISSSPLTDTPDKQKRETEYFTTIPCEKETVTRDGKRLSEDGGRENERRKKNEKLFLPPNSVIHLKFLF